MSGNIWVLTGRTQGIQLIFYIMLPFWLFISGLVVSGFFGIGVLYDGRTWQGEHVDHDIPAHDRIWDWEAAHNSDGIGLDWIEFVQHGEHNSINIGRLLGSCSWRE